MIRMQYSGNVIETAVRIMVSRLKIICNLSHNITTLYDVLSFQPGIVDGCVYYPDDAHTEQKGMAIEFKQVGYKISPLSELTIYRSVSFGYPLALNKALKDLSVKVELGTTINLVNRLYDCDSGDVYVDGRLIREYKVLTFRAAMNIVYQSYAYFPLTIRESLSMGCISSQAEKQLEAVENGAKLGGAYDFIQELPLKFQTNLEPVRTGLSTSDCKVVDREQFKSLAATEKHANLSEGQWQRLALSRSFMKYSDKTRLLCYDEPSAGLDPKAEVAMFERLRSLRGEKTMIFVTHRFGHLTKHADLIIYVGDGLVIEQGTHKSLLAEGGEYAKRYNIQSEAFAEATML
ncbi:ATP-binding ABC transporter [Rhizoctonia solani 123E]|uniref:ATP-binding ABC transporter n=1 Tax=Rhizoctonia solani 123E TaxID=1423351 RepID=A0A074SFR1_9AGAM|nr:ATP-binding ABC transporter [Rhizoctonia solani 123E]